MMKNHEYLIALMRAGNADEALAIQEEYAEDRAGDVHFLPIGGNPELSWKQGLAYNNRGAIENMEDHFGAHYEIVMNGFDSAVDLATPRLKTGPKTPIEALKEVGGAANVMVLTGRETRAAAPRRGRAPKERANVLTVDQGTGIAADAFSATIMSIMGNNKITNPLMAGSYGQGLKSNFRFTDKGVAVLYSRVKDSNQIAFTVTKIMARDNWKADGYVWQCDANGHALVADIAKIPSNVLRKMSDVIGANSVETAEKGMIVIGDYGTGVKLFGLEDFSSPIQVYNKLREIGFGMEYSAVQFRNGITTEQNTTKRAYNILGLRQSLNNRGEGDSYPVIWKASDLNHGKAIPVLDNQAEMEVWVVKRREGKVTKTHDDLNEPVKSILSKERHNSPIFVTLNGQTHKNIHSRIIFRNANLPYLDGYVIVEINCDKMDAATRRAYFTSNREGATRAMEDDIRREMEEFLKAMHGPLGRINREIRDSFLTGKRSPDSQSAVERMAEIMNKPLVGTILSKFGAPVADPKGTDGPGKKTETTTTKKKVTEQEDIVLTGTPDQLEVLNRSVAPGGQTFVTILTNATNDFAPDIEVDLPPFLTEEYRLVLDEGRMSVRVKCKPDTPLGEAGKVMVSLKRGTINLAAEAIITVAVREKKETKGTGDKKRMMPKINLEVITHLDPRWGSGMDAGLLMPVDVAYNAKPSGEGEFDVFINQNFPARKHLADTVAAKFRDKDIVEKTLADFDTAIGLMALADEEIEIGEAVVGSDYLHRSKAAKCRAQAIIMMLSLESLDKGRPSTKKSDVAAAA